MSTVDPLFAQWLQSDALRAVETDAALDARWGETALTTERITTLAFKADAVAEAQRQLAFRGAPLAIDVAELPGEWSDYIGRGITVTHDELGYEAGMEVFVIGAEDMRSKGISTVTMIRRL